MSPTVCLFVVAKVLVTDVNLKRPVGLLRSHSALRQSGVQHGTLCLKLSVEVLGMDIIAASKLEF